MVVKTWEELVERFRNIDLGIFVIMPNHFHAIIIIRQSVGAGTMKIFLINRSNLDEAGRPQQASQRENRQRWDKSSARSNPSRRMNTGVDEKGWARFDKRLWQRNYYEHIIRNDREMDASWRYIEANPAMWATDNENPHQPGR